VFISRFHSVMLLAAGFVIAESGPAQAGDLYVAPNGTASANGTVAQPYDLATALSGSVSRPGDTFWLRAGTYYLGQAYTEIHGAPGRPIIFRQVPGERAQLVGSLAVGGPEGHVIFRDLELQSGVDRRISKQNRVGFSPTDLPNFFEGIQVGAPNMSFINLVVHDSVRSAFYTAPEATNVLIYGCIVYNTGWASPDNAEGHIYYLQAPGEASENLGFNSTGANFHVYANGPGSILQNITLTGNVAWGAGALQNVRSYRDWIVGIDFPAVRAENISLSGNMGYLTSNTTTLTPVQLGREGANGTLVVTSNYWPQGVVINNWSNALVVGNTIAPQNSDDAIELQQNSTKRLGSWNHNCYVTDSSHRAFRLGFNNYSFGEWKNVTGCDSSSSCSKGPLQGVKVFVRPNRYEPGRANIVVYNWDNLNQVAVDVRQVVTIGAAYEVRNAQDFFSAPVLTGTFDGEPLRLPMNGLSTARPMGQLRTPPATGPTFNVFVLFSHAQKDH
jgi:hypothetical protein